MRQKTKLKSILASILVMVLIISMLPMNAMTARAEMTAPLTLPYSGDIYMLTGTTLSVSATNNTGLIVKNAGGGKAKYKWKRPSAG